MKEHEIKTILDLPLGDNDANAETIRDFLKSLLHELWEKEEGFSSKRPFGNSGWKHPVEVALIKAGVITGKLDAGGYIEDYDSVKSDQVILHAISKL